MAAEKSLSLITPFSEPLTAMAIARDEVISTPELLEHTLAHLPMRDLLTVAPLVSKAWQAITLSPVLQRALFFEPDLTGTQPVENPLLVELFPPFFLLPSGDWPPWSWPGNASRFKEMSWVTAPDAFKREDASWRRMLVTQPPTRTMVVTHMTHSRIGDFEQRAVLKDLSLRMGVLYDIAMPFVDGGASFSLRRHHDLDRGNDLSLAVWESVSCLGKPEPLLGELFASEGFESVELKFGERVRRV
ncbi:hypothetical protein B0H14DRAFT_402547 [Mycena olivaceomarginata]|nr:hypothetical protein B0H14DRAFT_402547 [Mycena olivaceomarginata]